MLTKVPLNVAMLSSPLEHGRMKRWLYLKPKADMKVKEVDEVI